MYKNWNYQDDDVKVSGNYLEHTRNGYSQTNAERHVEDLNIGRTDFLINNGDGTHRHISIDEQGHYENWGDDHIHKKW